MKRSRWLEGWSLVGWSTLLLLLVSGAVLAQEGSEEIGLRTAIRATARTSWALFLMVFVTSSWNSLRPSPVTRWLLRSRRALGVSLMVSMAAHAGFIVALATLHGASFWARLSPTTLVGGGFGYLLLLLMTATSFDRTAAWLGRRQWKRLHTFGIYYLWFVFAASFGPRSASQPAYLALTLPLLLALPLRIAAAVKRRRAQASRPAGVRDVIS